MKFKASAVAALCLCGLQALSAQSEVNALWNDTHGFGIWLYGRPGTCESFDYQNPPYLAFGTGVDKRTEVVDRIYDVSKLDACIANLENDVSVCTSGSIQLRYVAASNEYVGQYSIKLKTGALWQGDFRAQRCK